MRETADNPGGMVERIQHFCLDDGPGIRTTVFLKGCGLSCVWCHNPEMQGDTPRLAYLNSLCNRCGLCRTVCPAGVHRVAADGHSLNRGLCALCGECVRACPVSALYVSGTFLRASEILRAVKADRAFYGNGGGMTLSGGEALRQPQFAGALLRGAKSLGIHTAVETSGDWPPGVERLFPLVDLWLYDFKAGSDEKHRALCGKGNAHIRENLLLLAGSGADILLRYPVVPGINDAEDDLLALAGLVRETGRPDLRVELLRYHVLGKEKASRIGAAYPDFLPSRDALDDELNRVRKRLAALGVPLY